MREIKFRAFLETNKEMYSVCTIDFNNNDVGLINDDGNEITVSLNDVKLMQFTGLPDGKEIYEGDVYKRVLDKENRFKKSYEWADYWLVEWLDEHACFTATRIMESTDKGMVKITPERNRYSLLNYLEIDEIIGNICENKEQENYGTE